jgi:hypothetical protein
MLTGEEKVAYRLLMAKNYWKGELIEILGKKTANIGGDKLT